jgi:hypothetical protein
LWHLEDESRTINVNFESSGGLAEKPVDRGAHSRVLNCGSSNQVAKRTAEEGETDARPWAILDAIPDEQQLNTENVPRGTFFVSHMFARFDAG